MSHPPEDPFRPILREIAVVAAVLLVVLYLTACTAVAEPSKPGFPPDMRLVCHEGAYYLGSVSADQVVRLPLSCS